MLQACNNDNIGYDQNQRTTLYNLASKNGWAIDKVGLCETDCSALVAVCVNAAGIKVSKDMYTGNELSVLKATGQFNIYTSNAYCKKQDKLKKGDILLKNGHTAIVLEVEDVYDEKHKFDFEHVDILHKGKKVVIFAMGLMVQEAMKALPELQKKGIDATVVNVCCVKPLDVKGISKLLKENDAAYVCEEHNVIGGLYSAIAEVKASTTITTSITPIAINDTFGESGKMLEVLKKYGMTASNIVKVINKTYKK